MIEMTGLTGKAGEELIMILHTTVTMNGYLDILKNRNVIVFSGRSTLRSMISSSAKADTLLNIFDRLTVILRVVNSKSRKVKIQEFKIYCNETYEFILSAYPPPEIQISPTLHKLLAHSWEVMESSNCGRGLGNLSEGGLEACNKLLRRYRSRLSRKTSQDDNLRDTIRRLFILGDPELSDVRLKVAEKCQICKVPGHTRGDCNGVHGPMAYIDSVVNSFFW